MKAPLYTKKGNKKGELVLNPDIYATRVNVRLLELAQKAYAANLRHGTASTKVRKEVRGGGRKPWRQKGTGRARHGSIRSPIWKGGGVTFGPHPRSYYVDLSSTMRKKALISALSLRGGQKNVLVLEDVALEAPKTREWVDVVKKLPLDGKKSLCVVKDIDTNLYRASRNVLNWVKLRRANELNAYHVLQREKIIIERDALPVIENRLLTPEGATPKKAAKKTVKKQPKEKKS